MYEWFDYLAKSSRDGTESHPHSATRPTRGFFSAPSVENGENVVEEEVMGNGGPVNSC